MDITQPEIERYSENHTSPSSDILNKVERATHLKTLQPIMLSGNHQGQLLTMLTAMYQPKFILEIGTFTGYSALCFLDGMTEDAQLHSIELNPEWEAIIREHIALSDKKNQFHLHMGSALDIIDTINEPIDLVFMDAAKKEYIEYYHKLLPKMPVGGIILADNVLWKGKVLNDTKDLATQTLDDFNKLVQADPNVQNVLLPLRDGLMMIRKIK